MTADTGNTRAFAGCAGCSCMKQIVRQRRQMRTMSYNGVQNLIKGFEGFSTKAYKCPSGRWTIGWGSTVWLDGNPVKPGMTCTAVEASDLLRRDLQAVEAYVDAHMVNTPQWLFDACCDLAYNCGMAAWYNSTLRRKINDGSYILKEPDDGKMPR